MKICYEGDWKFDLSDGYGEIYYETGILMYKGYFTEGMFNGHGLKYKESGTLEREGEWRMDKPPFEVNCVIF